MTTSYILRVVGERGAAHQPLANYSGKQESAVEREAISLLPSLLVQDDMDMRKTHSLLVMYASAERDRPATRISVEE